MHLGAFARSLLPASAQMVSSACCGAGSRGTRLIDTRSLALSCADPVRASCTQGPVQATNFQGPVIITNAFREQRRTIVPAAPTRRAHPLGYLPQNLDLSHFLIGQQLQLPSARFLASEITLCSSDLQ